MRGCTMAMSGGQAVVETLRAGSVDTVFGRPGPAYLDFPQDLLNAMGELTIATPAPPLRSTAESTLVRRAAERLAGARRPVIIAGVGVHRAGASAALQALAEALQAPVFET